MAWACDHRGDVHGVCRKTSGHLDDQRKDGKFSRQERPASERLADIRRSNQKGKKDDIFIKKIKKIKKNHFFTSKTLANIKSYDIVIVLTLRKATIKPKRTKGSKTNENN